jgi:hypothetical protein
MTMRSAVFLIVVGACRAAPVSMENRPCEDGRCLAGYVCHPELSVCVKNVPVDCVKGVCPSRLQTGDLCDAPRSFVPCDDLGASDCSQGCRTCTGDHTWSECSLKGWSARDPNAAPPPVTNPDGASTGPPSPGPSAATGSTGKPGATGATGSTGASGPTGCAADCTKLPHVKDGICAANRCWIDACERGYIDLDHSAATGCEYFCTPRGVERCNGVDDDCDGQVDNLSPADLADDCSHQHPHARHIGTWACTGGECKAIACLGGWADINGSLDDGCEGCGPTGVEVCGDGIDNDCNGLTDEPGAYGCHLRFHDGDGDGLGLAQDWRCVCTDAAPYSTQRVGDCDDTSALCTTDCSDADHDGVPDCRDPCLDMDHDGAGVSNPNVPPGCRLGPDCDDTSPQCNVSCADTDGDGVPDCRDPCVDLDRDGFGVGAGCRGPDCDETSALCNVTCVDTDGDGIPDCRDPCIDPDGDGYGVSNPPAGQCPFPGVDCKANARGCNPGAGCDSATNAACVPASIRITPATQNARFCTPVAVTIALDQYSAGLAHLACTVAGGRQTIERTTFDNGPGPWVSSGGVEQLGSWDPFGGALSCGFLARADGMLVLRAGGGSFQRGPPLSTVGYTELQLGATIDFAEPQADAPDNVDNPAVAEVTVRACCLTTGACTPFVELPGPPTRVCATGHSVSFGPEADQCADAQIQWVFAALPFDIAIDDVTVSGALNAVSVVAGADPASATYTANTRACPADGAAAFSATLTCTYADGVNAPQSAGATVNYAP